MKRKLLIGLSVFIAVLLAAGGWWAWNAGVRRDQIVAGLPALPDFGAANATMKDRIQKADAAARARFGGVKALGRLSRLYHANGFYNEAQACYDMLERLEPSEPRWFHRQASILAGYGDVEPAMKLWQRVLVLAPDYFVARLRIGDSELKAGHDTAAAAAYQDVLKRNADNPWALLGLARIDYEEGHWDAARQRLESVARQTENQIGADLLVTVYQRLGRMDLARETLGTAKTGGIYRDPPDPWIDELVNDCYDAFRISLAAGVYSHSGHPAKAEELLRRALEIAPNDVSTRFQLATLLQTQQKGDEALAQLRRCTEIAPDFADGWAWLSAALARTGDAAGGARALADGLSHCPGSPGLHLMYARELQKANRVGEAVNEYLTSIKLRPNEPDAYTELGMLFIKQGQMDEGVQQIRAALAQDPAFPMALSVMAFSSIAANDQGEAKRWMQRVSEQPRVESAQYERLTRAYREQFGQDWQPESVKP